MQAYAWLIWPFYPISLSPFLPFTLVGEFQATSPEEQNRFSLCEMGRTNIKKEKPPFAVKIGCLANAKINKTEIFGAYTSFLQLAAWRIFYQ